MVDRVLVPMDRSPMARRALEHALATYPDATVTVLHVLDFRESDLAEPLGDHPGEFDEWLAAGREAAEDLFDEVRELADEYGADVETGTAVGRAARSIVEYADEHDVDLVVLGSHGRSGLSRILLGSVAETVTRRAPVPVTVVR